MKTQLRPLLLSDSDVFAGTEKHILELALGLVELGVGASIACPTNSPLAKAAKAVGLTVYSAPRNNFAIHIIPLLLKLIQSRKVNVLHAHNGVTHAAAATAAATCKRAACIASIHFLKHRRSERRGFNGVLSKLAHSLINLRTDRFIAVSQAVAHAGVRSGEVNSSRVVVVHNGIAPIDSESLPTAALTRLTLSIPPDVPTVISVTRLEREKDVHILIQAIHLVVREIPNVVCLIVGDGTLRTELADSVKGRNLDRNIHFVGFRGDVTTLIKSCDILVLPGKNEGFGLALLEAMSLGKPVVAVDAGGPSEIVQNGETGLLVPPGDVSQLAQAIIKLLKDIPFAQQAGAMAHQRFAKLFSSEHMAAQTLSVYEQAVDKHQ